MSGSALAMPVAPLSAEPPRKPPLAEDPPSGLTAGRVVTILLVCGPVVILAFLLLFGGVGAVPTGDIVLASVMYLVTGFGVAVGLHRLFAHHSFKANRVLKIALAVAGSMALEGSMISWVAIHRRHHMFSDQPGDPHSPHRYGSGPLGTLKGFVWAHVAWLFASDPTDSQRFAPDLLRDKDLAAVDRLFPVLAVTSLVIPFAVGWLLYGTLAAALTAFFWAGLIRMAFLHHVTWSINSICHLSGRRPFSTSDQSTNFAPLALVSFGESWHNFHHSSPASARHGALPHQVDLAARMIRLFEQAGWATKVRWPTSVQIAALAGTGSTASGRTAPLAVSAELLGCDPVGDEQQSSYTSEPTGSAPEHGGDIRSVLP
jgi:stearoyl-CoA desaturase (delta-9 desaturase)